MMKAVQKAINHTYAKHIYNEGNTERGFQMVFPNNELHSFTQNIGQQSLEIKINERSHSFKERQNKLYNCDRVKIATPQSFQGLMIWFDNLPNTKGAKELLVLVKEPNLHTKLYIYIASHSFIIKI